MPKISPEFVWRMEDVLELYAKPVDEKRPLVCFDERLCQLIADIHPGFPMKPKQGEKSGQPSRYDYEYERQLYTQAWKLAQHSGGRIIGFGSPMSQTKNT